MSIHKQKIVRLLPVIITMAIASLLFACSSTRNIVEQSKHDESIQPRSIIAQLAESYNDWNDVNLPISIDIAQPVNFGFSGRATMIRNESIHISMRVFGMEVAVVHIDNDSTLVVDKFHKYICSVPTSKLTGNNKFTISDLQDMMLGRACYPGKGTVASEQEVVQLFSIEMCNDSTLLFPHQNHKSISWHHIISPASNLIATNMEFANDYWLSIDYSNFSETVAGIVASNIHIKGSTGSINIEANLNWNIGKAKWNSGSTDSWEPPTNYKQISAESLINALKK